MKAFDPISAGLRLLAGLILAGALSACTSDPATQSDLVSYVDNPAHGLVRSRKLGDLKIDVQYRPLAYMAAHKGNGQLANPETYHKAMDSYSGMYHFLLKLDVARPGVSVMELGIGGEQDYQRRLHYFSFGMKDDLVLVAGNDTLTCALFHFERAFDMSTHRNFVLAFPRKANAGNEGMTLIYDSREFGTGPLKFRFQAADLKNIPQIALAQ